MMVCSRRCSCVPQEAGKGGCGGNSSVSMTVNSHSLALSKVRIACKPNDKQKYIKELGGLCHFWENNLLGTSLPHWAGPAGALPTCVQTWLPMFLSRLRPWK